MSKKNLSTQAKAAIELIDKLGSGPGHTSFVCPICGCAQFHKLFTCTDYFVSGEDFDIVSCGSCNLRITLCSFREDELSGYYRSENYISHSNTRKGTTNRVYHLARKLMLKKKQKWVEKRASGTNKKLLDVGCGTGYFASCMQKRGWSVLGVEKSDVAREFALKNFALQTVFSLDKIDKNSRFDVITLWHVLEHLEDLNGFMQSFNQLLTLQGKLFVAVPNHQSADARKYRAHWAAYDVPRHRWHFAPAQMARLAHKHGFRITTIKPFHLDGFYISILSEKYKDSPMFFIKGFFSGLNTWLSTLVDTERSSSLMYVLEKVPK